MDYKIPTLPLQGDIETKAVLKKAALAHKALAEPRTNLVSAVYVLKHILL